MVGSENCLLVFSLVLRPIHHFKKPNNLTRFFFLFQIKYVALFKGFIFVFGLAGNGAVVAIITALRRRGQKSSVQLFLLNLAICDLMVCLLCISLTFFTNFYYPTEYHTRDSGLCKLARFMQVIKFSFNSPAAVDLLCFFTNPLGLRLLIGKKGRFFFFQKIVFR